MLDPTRETGAGPGSLSEILLDAKVAIQPLRPGGVSRRGLIDDARASGSRVVSVTAPAGYGKSTLLAEWATVDRRAVGWASLDRFDDSPAALLTLLAAASADLSPHAADVLLEMRGVSTSLLARSAPMLASALARAPEPFVLLVDDIHSAASFECHDALEIVLGGVPSGSQVVLAGRHEQPWLARLRIELPLLEIGTDDLRMDVPQAKTIFAESRADVSDDDVTLAVTRSEGWPTGLRLCALAIRSGASMPELSGGERFVADYLYHECMAGLLPELQEFLRRTAVLDQLTAELCDAVVGTQSAWTMLRHLEAQGLFLIPLDRQGRWYRYHALFREFLLADLHRHEHAIVPELHTRAASWLEQEGMLDLTVEHLLAAGDVEGAGALVTELALPTYQRGDIAVVERWLHGVGDAVIASSPALAVIAAWGATLQGRSPDAERWAAVLEDFDVADAPEDDRIAFESARAMVRAAMCPRGWEQVLADARYAVEHEPAWSPWRDQALHLLGSGLLLAGDKARAREAFREASACALRAGNHDSVVLSEPELALLAMDEGAWGDAEAHAHTAVRAIDENHMEGYPTTGLALAVAARLALRRGDKPAAERLLTRAMRARVQCTHVLPFLAMRTRMQIATVYMVQGDRPAAMHLLHEIDGLLARCPQVGALRDEIELLRTRLADAAASTASVPLTPAEMRLLPYLQTHLTIAEIGQRLYVSRNTVSSEVGSIYRKLGVASRSAAVDAAVGLGLLGD